MADWHEPKTWKPGSLEITAPVLNYELRDLLRYFYDTLIGPDFETGWVDVDGGIGFQNSWIDAGSPQALAAYIKEGNWVSLRGVIEGGAVPSIAFTLPVGYRPPYIHRIPVVSNNAYGQIQVDTDGDVSISVGSTISVWLFNVRFRVI